jgi:hypothetical protein
MAIRLPIKNRIWVWYSPAGDLSFMGLGAVRVLAFERRGAVRPKKAP